MGYRANTNTNTSSQIGSRNVGGIDGLSGGAPAPCSSPANSYPHSFHQCNQCEKISVLEMVLKSFVQQFLSPNYFTLVYSHGYTPTYQDMCLSSHFSV